MTQNERVLDYLKTHTSITPIEAWSQLGVYRLGARVYDLRKDGHDISSGLTEVKNRFGESCRVAEYRLEK